MEIHERLDKVGGTASALCAVHCAAMPMAITVLPLLGLGFLASEAVEWCLFTASAVMGLASLCWGYRKHADRRALALLAIGLALLAIGRMLHHGHDGHHEFNPWLVLGGFVVAGSHYANWLLCKNCHQCGHHD